MPPLVGFWVKYSNLTEYHCATMSFLRKSWFFWFSRLLAHCALYWESRFLVPKIKPFPIAVSGQNLTAHVQRHKANRKNDHGQRLHQCRLAVRRTISENDSLKFRSKMVLATVNSNFHFNLWVPEENFLFYEFLQSLVDYSAQKGSFKVVDLFQKRCLTRDVPKMGMTKIKGLMEEFKGRLYMVEQKVFPPHQIFKKFSGHPQITSSK